MDPKLTIALVSLVAGWCLSQATEILKGYWRRKQLKGALLAELGDVERKTSKALEYCEKFIDDLNSGLSGHITPQPVKTHIFDKYYAEMYTSFSAAERSCIGAIYGHIDKLNELVSEYSDANKHEIFANMYSPAMWATASIKQYKENSSVHISENAELVVELNQEFQNYVQKVKTLYDAR